MSELLARFDASVSDMWEPHPAPTAESISTIEKHFGCRLPPLLLLFASRSCSFSSFFLGLGPDFDSHTHIIHKNNSVRSDKDWLQPGAIPPSRMVFITDNFMGNFFWCMDISQTSKEHPVVFWSAETAEKNPVVYTSFEQFIQATVEFYERKLNR